MSTVNKDMHNIIATLSYINDNQVDLPRKGTEVLKEFSMRIMLAKLGVFDRTEVFVEMRNAWSYVDNGLCEVMGYEPLTQWTFMQRLDHVGRFITRYFKESEIESLRHIMDNVDLPPETEQLNALDMDMDQLMWDTLVPWFLERMENDRVPA